MQTYYTFTNFFNSVCLSHPNIETFTVGDLANIDMAKQTLFPLSHLIVNNVNINIGYSSSFWIIRLFLYWRFGIYMFIIIFRVMVSFIYKFFYKYVYEINNIIE